MNRPFASQCHPGRTGAANWLSCGNRAPFTFPDLDDRPFSRGVWTPPRAPGIPAPPSFSPRSAGTSTRGKPGRPATLNAAPALVSAVPDASRFPAPAAWGAGLRPPLQHRHPGGCLWLDAGLRPVGHCFAAPPAFTCPVGRACAHGHRLNALPHVCDFVATRPPRFPRGLATARPRRLHCAPPGKVGAASFLPCRPAGNRSRVPREEPTARPG